MIGLSTRLGKNYAIDVAGFYRVRSLKDGISLVGFDVDFSWYKADHHPKFEVVLIVLNFMILDISVYNIHHITEDV